MITPQSSALGMSSTQKISPPRAPCSAATTTLPFTVARTTRVNLICKRRLWLSPGHRRADATDDVQAVPQEEEQQVEHEEEADHHLEGVLADGERLGGDELTALHGAADDAVAQAVEVVEAEAVELVLEGFGQHLANPRDIGADVQLAGIQPLVEIGPCCTSRAAMRNTGRIATSRQTPRKSAPTGCRARPSSGPAVVAGAEHHRQHHRPEHRAVERQENPAEGQGHQDQQQDQRTDFEG